MAEAPLRAVVVGAGFAGQGHTVAMRYAGVEVVAICARQAPVVQAVAQRLGIPEASTDWAETIRRVRPDIVCLGTPGTLRRPVIELAARLGIHLYSDKPLGVTAEDAGEYAALVERAGIKHAYASTHRYDPSVALLAELVRDGAIGTLLEIEGTFRRHLSPLTPWTWYDTIATGGGLLSNAFPHWLGILQRITGGPIMRAMGEARLMRDRAPYVPDLHDFRDRGKHTPTPEQAQEMEWRACDAENAFSALLRFRPEGNATGAPAIPSSGEVQANILATGATATWPPNGWRLFGTEGTLIADGHYSYTIWRQRTGRDQREPIEIPNRLERVLPRPGDEFENKWAALAQDFVRDIQGQPHDPYLTFHDGYRFQQTIEAIRSGQGWTTIR